MAWNVSRLTRIAVPFNSTRARVDALGSSFQNEGQHGHSAPFSWAA